MKLKLLDRNDEFYRSSVKNKPTLRLTNYDLVSKPMAVMKEYQRALQSAKIDRMFAKPFVHSFTGHLDAIKSLALTNTTNYDFFSGSCDGELRFWNISKKKCIRSLKGIHSGFINGIVASRDDKYVFSAGQDCKIHQWNFQKYFAIDNTTNEELNEAGDMFEDPITMQFSTLINVTPSASFTTDGAIYSIDYSPFEDKFITAGRQLCLWDVERSEIVQNFKWGNDDIIFAKYSPNEPNLIITTQYDNSITFYDLRVGNAVQKLTLNMRSNAARFNPMKPYMFAVANDDSNVYSFDFRNFTKAKTIHAGFVNAALDVDFSPLGTELVAGSFDHTVRIWKADSSRSREIYHNKRMQAAFQVRYTHDSKYILTGSADMNVRLWKSEASMLERIPSVREKKSLQYRNALKEKYAHMPEISKILTKRQLPKYIYNQTKVRYVHSQAEKRKEENRIKNDPKNAERQPLHKSMISKVAFEGQKRHELKEFANEDDEEDFIEEPPSDFSVSD